VVPWLTERESELYWFENDRTEVMVVLAEQLMDTLMEEVAQAMYRLQLKRALLLN